MYRVHLCTVLTSCVHISFVLKLSYSNRFLFKDAAIDGDNSEHILWVFEKAQERANEYGIQGITYRLTQGVWCACVAGLHLTSLDTGVVKRIIPAVASTNAVIAGNRSTRSNV